MNSNGIGTFGTSTNTSISMADTAIGITSASSLNTGITGVSAGTTGTRTVTVLVLIL